MRLPSMLKVFYCRESGVSFIETAVVLAVLGTITVIFLTGMMTSSRAAFISDKQATAESLAQSQTEWAQNASYTANATTYSPAPIPSGKDYINYSANITAQSLNTPDDGIQKITVTVSYSGLQILTLESYKVNR